MSWLAFAANAVMAATYSVLAATSGGAAVFIICACCWSIASAFWLAMALEGR